MIHIYDSVLKSCLFVWIPISFDIDLLWTTMSMLLEYLYHAIHGELISINESVHLTTSICGMPSRSGDYVGEVYLVSPVYGDIQIFIFWNERVSLDYYQMFLMQFIWRTGNTCRLRYVACCVGVWHMQCGSVDWRALVPSSAMCRVMQGLQFCNDVQAWKTLRSPHEG